jgi:hypothetical protein
MVDDTRSGRKEPGLNFRQSSPHTVHGNMAEDARASQDQGAASRDAEAGSAEHAAREEAKAPQGSSVGSPGAIRIDRTMGPLMAAGCQHYKRVGLMAESDARGTCHQRVKRW